MSFFIKKVKDNVPKKKFNEKNYILLKKITATIIQNSLNLIFFKWTKEKKISFTEMNRINKYKYGTLQIF